MDDYAEPHYKIGDFLYGHPVNWPDEEKYSITEKKDTYVAIAWTGHVGWQMKHDRRTQFDRLALESTGSAFNKTINTRLYTYPLSSFNDFSHEYWRLSAMLNPWQRCNRLLSNNSADSDGSSPEKMRREITRLLADKNLDPKLHAALLPVLAELNKAAGLSVTG